MKSCWWPILLTLRISHKSNQPSITSSSSHLRLKFGVWAATTPVPTTYLKALLLAACSSRESRLMLAKLDTRLTPAFLPFLPLVTQSPPPWDQGRILHHNCTVSAVENLFPIPFDCKTAASFNIATCSTNRGRTIIMGASEGYLLRRRICHRRCGTSLPPPHGST
ncbi:hypothetical protein GALMADRAFT_1212050 [Galerina marginata CBS 339.88]|uniref:Uncharacterized protein n=1 Tax=Galerina marginata (strain CBS 339.88) TaxID=685588 RepID=A0A067S5C6_GALM3|nr:hypothetical protein GALMADRAFT_1212050 [Galerina marginata CBS 339.88]